MPGPSERRSTSSNRGGASPPNTANRVVLGMNGEEEDQQTTKQHFETPQRSKGIQESSQGSQESSQGSQESSQGSPPRPITGYQPPPHNYWKYARAGTTADAPLATVGPSLRGGGGQSPLIVDDGLSTAESNISNSLTSTPDSETFKDWLAGNYNLRQKRNGKAAVWRLFCEVVTKDSNNIVPGVTGCSECYKVALAKEAKSNGRPSLQWCFPLPGDRSTSRLRQHCIKLHKKEFETASKLDGSSAAEGITTGKGSIKHFAANTQQETFEQAVLSFLVAQNLPFSTVDAPSFSELVRSLNQRVSTFGRAKLVSLLQARHAIVYKAVKEVIKGQKIALTLDHWSSKGKDNYMAITCLWIDVDWSMKSAVLRCRKHVATRWWSTYEMLTRLLEVKEDLRYLHAANLQFFTSLCSFPKQTS